MAATSLLAPARDVKPVHSEDDQAKAYAAGWRELDKAKALISAIIGAHRLSFSLPYDARQHIGYLEGRAVQVGLAHGWDWAIMPHGAGVVSAWEELRAIREEAIEMAMRAAGCGRYSWEANPDLFLELSDAAPAVEQVIGQALAAQDEDHGREAA